MDPLQVLPYDTCIQLMSFLDGKEVLTKVARICKKWNSISKDERLWKTVCLRKWEDAQPIHDGTWKQLWRQKNLQFEWNVEVLKSRSDITAKNSNRTILRRYEPEEGPHSINVRGNRKFTAADGVVYWEVKLENVISPLIFIGVCSEEMDEHIDLAKSLYSWTITKGAKWHRTPENLATQQYTPPPYGWAHREGDRIGVLLDMTKKTVGFYHNGVYMGEAFTDLPDFVWPVVGLSYRGDMVSVSFPPMPEKKP